MVYNVYSIRDILTEFGRPFTCPSDDFAKRDFSAAVHSNPENNSVAFAPADYELYRLGQYDSKNGKFTCEAAPVFIVRGSDLVG